MFFIIDENNIDIARWTRDEIRSADEIGAVIFCMIAATVEVHKKGVAHRDIKPQNFFMNGKPGQPDFKVVVGDFGLSKNVDKEAPSTKVGSDFFKAPEVDRGRSGHEYDLKCDAVLGRLYFLARSPRVSVRKRGSHCEKKSLE